MLSELDTVATITTTASVFTLLVAIMGLANAIGYKRGKDVGRAERERMLEVIVKSYSLELLYDLKDINNILEVHRGPASAKLEIKDTLSSILREILVNIYNGKYDKYKFNKKEFKEFLSKSIEENEKENPFEDLPRIEKALHNDLKLLIEMNKTSEALIKLNEVASVSVSKQVIVDKLNRQASWTIPLAVIGIIFSIFFGVLPFFPK